MEEFPHYIGMAIRKIRKENGVTQVEFAEQLGDTPVSSIKSIERGKGVSLKKLDVIADELGVTASYLVYLGEQLREEAYALLKQRTR